jgi:hypothetical protein
MVSNTADSMPVADEYRQILISTGFDSWLEEQRNAFIIEQYLDTDKIVWAFQHV